MEPSSWLGTPWAWAKTPQLGGPLESQLTGLTLSGAFPLRDSYFLKDSSPGHTPGLASTSSMLSEIKIPHYTLHLMPQVIIR